MPYSFAVFPEHALFVVTCKGVISDDDLYDFSASVMVETRLSQATQRLFDARKVTATTFSPFTFWRLLSSIEPPHGMQRAFVLPVNGFRHWPHRIALKLSKGGRDSKIFADMREALIWLNVNDDTVTVTQD